METLRPERTRRMRWMSLVMVPLIALVIAVHVAGRTTLAAVLRRWSASSSLCWGPGHSRRGADVKPVVV
jgi:hypothetical protein